MKKHNKKDTSIFSDLTNKDNKIKSDTDGSYTGVAEDNDYPIQDADDL